MEVGVTLNPCCKAHSAHVVTEWLAQALCPRRQSPNLASLGAGARVLEK